MLTYSGLSANLTPPDGAKDKLYKNADSSFVETQPDGLEIHYDINGRL